MPTPAVTTTTISTDRCSQRTIRERLGPDLGLYLTGSITTVAANFEAERYLISSDVRSDAAPADLFDNLWVYIRDGDQVGAVRKLIPGAYDAPLGALVVDRPFLAPLAGGDTFEVSMLPVTGYLGVGGMNDAINQGLALLPLIDKMTLTSDGTQRVSLADYQWPIKRIRRILVPSTTDDDAPLWEWRGRASLEFDAETPYLQFYGSAPVNDGEDFVLEVERPANTRIGSLDVWSDTATGLVNDFDEAMYGVEPIARNALPIALEMLAQTHPRGSQERNDLLADAQTEQRLANIARWYNRPASSGAQRVGATWRRGTRYVAPGWWCR